MCYLDFGFPESEANFNNAMCDLVYSPFVTVTLIFFVLVNDSDKQCLITVCLKD